MLISPFKNTQKGVECICHLLIYVYLRFVSRFEQHREYTNGSNALHLS